MRKHWFALIDEDWDLTAVLCKTTKNETKINEALDLLARLGKRLGEKVVATGPAIESDVLKWQVIKFLGSDFIDASLLNHKRIDGEPFICMIYARILCTVC